MPRKRRQLKRRIPQALNEVSRAELARWVVSGPLLADEVDELHHAAPYVIWPDWGTWAAFYGQVREQWGPDRPWIREGSTAEALYRAHLSGANVDILRDKLAAQRRACDPRRLLRLK